MDSWGVYAWCDWTWGPLMLAGPGFWVWIGSQVRSPRNQLIDGGIPQSGLSRLPSKTDHHTTAGELGASSTVISLLDSPACIWSAWSCPSYPPCLSATPSPSPLPGHRVPVRGYILTYNTIYYHIYVLPYSQSAHTYKLQSTRATFSRIFNVKNPQWLSKFFYLFLVLTIGLIS